MTNKLVLENGTVFTGNSFGLLNETTREMVFDAVKTEIYSHTTV